MKATVVVDARMPDHSGIGTYVGNLMPRIAALEPGWIFHVIIGADSNRGADWARVPNVSVSRSSAGVYSVREQVELVLRGRRDADLYWATHYNFPLALTKPLVVTVHDVAHLRLPEYTRSFAKRGYARTMLRAGRRRAGALMFDSEFTRREFTAIVGEPPARSEVVPLGVAPEWFQEKRGERPVASDYFVYVGNIKPHKNVPVLLEAFRRLGDTVNARLILIGQGDNLRTADAAVEGALARLGDRITVLGAVDFVTLRRYVQHAIGLVMPSLYEGFGLPPLEAMAAGCPTIVSRAGSLPEVCGDAAATFDPADPEELAQRMRAMATDSGMRQDFIRRGRDHVRRFDWDVSARRTRDILTSVLQDAAAHRSKAHG